MNRSGRQFSCYSPALRSLRRSPRLNKPSQRSHLRRRRRRSPTTKGRPKKLVPPVRGEATIGYLKPVTKQDENMIITTIKIKNLSNGAIAGLKVDEFWYDKDGNPVTGSQPFRWRKPLQPGEVIDVVLQVPRNPAMNRNQYKFEHANGTIKATLLPKL